MLSKSPPASQNEKTDNEKLLKIQFDSDTAARLFKNKFTIKYLRRAIDRQSDYNHDHVVQTIEIDGYEASLWSHLYNSFDIGNY